MQTHTLLISRDGSDYEARLVEMGGIAYESVSGVPGVGEPVEIHSAEFPALLGSAARDGYLAVMLPSVLNARERAARTSISLADALEGRVAA